MARDTNREDLHPWEKICVTKEVAGLLGHGETLSSSLRMTKFSPVGGRVKKPAVDWMCDGLQQSVSRPFDVSCGVTFQMKLKSRLIVNHSGGVMENASLALHPHFGTPVIPGSAVKGIARHAAWCVWKDAEEEDRDLYAGIIAELFGYPTGEDQLDKALSATETRSGAVAFLQAEVVGRAVLEADLVNSHTGPSPVPVFFPAVAAGTVFSFHIFPLKQRTENDSDTLLFFAESWLKEGLKIYGAGAKTNAGYGWFEEVE